MTIKKNRLKLLLLINCILLPLNLYSACCGDVQRGEGPYQCPSYCNWQRPDNRCNNDSECCPGSYCSAFLYCENCR